LLYRRIRTLTPTAFTLKNETKIPSFSIAYNAIENRLRSYVFQARMFARSPVPNGKSHGSLDRPRTKSRAGENFTGPERASYNEVKTA
jgi:hypothetical protein